jgi:acyl-CoA hydrolase
MPVLIAPGGRLGCGRAQEDVAEAVVFARAFFIAVHFKHAIRSGKTLAQQARSAAFSSCSITVFITCHMESKI